jgi:hypothetical protein
VTTMTTYEEDSVAALAANPDRLASLAVWSAEDLLDTCYRRGDDPARYHPAAVARRAEREVRGDLETDLRFGFSHTPQEAETYRTVYTAAFVAAWQREVEGRAMQRKRARGSIIVCYR